MRPLPAFAIFACLALASRLAADPAEPPADVPEGVDHAEAADDSIAGGVEVGLGLMGGEGRAIERRRRVRFAEGDLSGTVREGSRDPLAGGALVERAAWGEIAAGKLAPRWGRGLLLGAPGDPWQRASLDPAGSGRRGPSGEGVEYRHGGLGADLLLGRFDRRALGGARVTRGAFSLGLLGDPRGGAQTGLGFQGAEQVAEVALDRSGSWRGQALWGRARGGWSLAANARAGSAAFRSLAEPRRGGPARALALGLSRTERRGSLRVLTSAWRYRAARAGARAALDVTWRLGDGALFAAGFEEQQGYRGELRSESALRQGAWIEWSRPADPVGMLVRHETWGARPGLRGVTRLVTSFGIEARLPGGAAVSLAHCVFGARRGESLYLRETESDRMVLRALAGEGRRTRLIVTVPAGRGTLRLTGQITALESGPRSPRWSLEWTRRSRSLARRPRGAGGAPDTPAEADSADSNPAPGARPDSSSAPGIRPRGDGTMRMGKIWMGSAVMLTLVAPLARAESPLKLNEFLAGPARDWDGSGTVSTRDDEWVEVTNTGAAALDLAGYLITDGDRLPRLALSGTLAPGGLRVAFGKESYDWERANGFPAFGLSLGNTGDKVMLWQVVGPDTVLADSYTYLSHEAASDRAVGRTPDGGAWALLDGLNPYTGSIAPLGTGCMPSPGGSSLCGVTPSRVASWGRVKALYR